MDKTIEDRFDMYKGICIVYIDIYNIYNINTSSEMIRTQLFLVFRVSY